MKKHFRLFKGIILFFTAFIGVGAIFGSMMFFIDPQNGFVMGSILPAMREKMPFGELLFSNFVFSGISLIIVNGLTNMTAFALILLGKKSGYFLGWFFGITLMLWICIQFYIFAPVVYAIDIVFFILGLLQFIFGYLAYVGFCKNSFVFEESSYQRIDMQNPKEAVFYFSREGYSKKLAYEKANELGCGVFEIKTTERTEGTPGFWWCGRFAMHQWGMPIEPIQADLAAFERVHIICPIWAFGICSPVRQFLTDNREGLKSVELTIVHFMKARLSAVFKEPEELLGDKLTAKASVCSRFGRFKTLG